MEDAIAPPRCALVVEDARDDQGFAAVLLEEYFGLVEEAGSPEDALQFLREHASEVALAFINTTASTTMDRIDLARWISALWPWVRVVVAGHPIQRLPDLPQQAVYMPQPWRPLDLLVQAERTIQAHAASARHLKTQETVGAGFVAVSACSLG